MDLVVNRPRQQKQPSTHHEVLGAFQQQESGISDMSRLAEGKAGPPEPDKTI